MNAKEMFEELGYTKHEHKLSIEYFMQNPDNHSVYEVVFDLVEETCSVRVWKRIGLDTHQNIDAILHLAIHQQMKELGWIK